MYNTERKELYINEREMQVVMSSNTLNNIFSKTEPLEEEYERDVAEFSIPQILELYKRINTKSVDLLLNINTQMSTYASWCMSHLLIPNGINNFQEITLEMLNECINKLANEQSIMSREDILRIAYSMKNAREKFVVLMCYETGRSKHFQNIFMAKMEDFTEDGWLNTYDGRRVRISRELYFAAQEADIELDYNSFVNVPDSPTALRQRKLIDRGYIYKETDTVNNVETFEQQRIRLNIAMRKNFDAIGLPGWIQLKEIESSGVINMIKEIAKRENVGDKEVLWNKMLRSEVEYQYGISIRSPKQFLRKYGQFLD